MARDNNMSDNQQGTNLTPSGSNDPNDMDLQDSDEFPEELKDYE